MGDALAMVYPDHAGGADWLLRKRDRENVVRSIKLLEGLG